MEEFELQLKQRNHKELMEMLSIILKEMNKQDSSPDIIVDTKAIENSMQRLTAVMSSQTSLTKADIESIVNKLDASLRDAINNIKIEVPAKEKVTSIDLVKNIHGITTRLKFNY